MNYELVPMQPFGVMLLAHSSTMSVNNLPIERLRELARRHHLLALRGFSTFSSANAFADYCDRWGAISLWPFGKVLDLVEQVNPKDHIFDNNYVPMHWDGMYRPQVPEFQIFHCVSAPQKQQGGRTTFSNTVLALEHAKPEIRDLWAKATGIYHRKMEFYDSKTVAPIIATHPVQGFPVIRYNEPPHAGDTTFLNHPEIAFTGIEANQIASFQQSLRESLYAPENFYAHSWQTGDIVVSDNYTLLHGREAFTSSAPRHLRRIHILGEPPLDNPHLVTHT